MDLVYRVIISGIAGVSGTSLSGLGKHLVCSGRYCLLHEVTTVCQ